MPIASNIDAVNFRRYGLVIACPAKKAKDKKNSIFSILLSQPAAKGWRAAHLLLRDKTVDYLERHIDSFESFEPLKGKALLYVARTRDPEKIRCFYLDKPVILKKGIWHGVVTLGKEAEFKIFENAQVKCRYWQLGFSLKAI